MLKKFVLGLAALVCLSGASTVTQIDRIEQPNDPVWIKVGRIDSSKVTVFFDFTSLKSVEGISTGVIMYVPDKPTEEIADDGKTKKLAASRVMNMVVDCQSQLFGILQLKLYEVERPTLMDKPVKTKIYDPVIVAPMNKGSPIDRLFCPDPKNVT